MRILGTNRTMVFHGRTENTKPRLTKTWVCSIATLSLLLWGSNLLPIQSVHYQLTTSLAISQHRIPLLEGLLAKNPSPTFSLLAIQRLGNSEPASAELQSVRVVLKLAKRSDAHDIERLLDELTIPTAPNEDCLKTSKQATKQRWIVESMQHSLKRLMLDTERDQKAIAIDSDTEPNTHPASPISVGPFRLSSYSSSSAKQRQENQSLMSELEKHTNAQSEQLNGLLLNLERMNARARGFLSATGSPRLEPVTHAVSIGRFTILCLLCVFIWLLCMAWVSPVKAILSWIGPKPTAKVVKSSDANRDSLKASDEVKRLVRLMKKAKIPYLGAMQFTGDALLPQSSTAVTTTSAAYSSPHSLNNDESNGAIQWLYHMAQLTLVLWLGLFVGRVLFDPAWRELGIVSPMGAISRMVFGIS